MKDKVREWIELASVDLAAAMKLADDEYLTPAAPFHAHQCIEKSFKAILEFYDSPIRKIHDLTRLYLELKDIVAFQCNEDILYDLSRLYIDSRYPGLAGYTVNGKPSVEDAKSYIDSADKILSEAVKLVEMAQTPDS